MIRFVSSAPPRQTRASRGYVRLQPVDKFFLRERLLGIVDEFLIIGAVQFEGFELTAKLRQNFSVKVDAKINLGVVEPIHDS